LKSNHLERDNYAFRILSDLASIVIAYCFTSIFIYRNYFIQDKVILLFLILAWYFSSKWTNLYDDFRTLKFIDEFLLLLPIVALQALIMIVCFFVMNDHAYARRFVLDYSIGLLGILVTKKYLFKKIYQHFRLKGSNVRNLLIIGSNDIGLSFFDFIKSNNQFGYKVVGFIDATKNDRLNGLYKGRIEDIERIIGENEADEIIIALPDFDKDQINYIISIGEKKAIRTRIIPEYFRFNSNKFTMEMFGNFPMVTVRDEPLNQIHCRLVKRMLDVFVSLFLCVFIFSWLFPIIAILIKLDSKGSVFYIHERWGRNNEHFKFFKFRTMRVDSELVIEGKFQQTTANDARITPIGAFLRKTSLDELPQFFNVLLGNMSIVGPRPHAVPHNIESQVRINNYSIRHWVKPGITGWAQVNGLRGETKEFDLMRRRVEFDIWYIENWTPWLDIRIFSMTVYNFVKGDLMAY
jgi:putative colanic acid biosynthesis UDP-glucose lipid carrier transferase